MRIVYDDENISKLFTALREIFLNMDPAEAYINGTPSPGKLLAGLNNKLKGLTRQKDSTFEIPKRAVYDPEYTKSKMVLETYDLPRYDEANDTGVEQRVVGFLCVKAVGRFMKLVVKDLEGDVLSHVFTEGGSRDHVNTFLLSEDSVSLQYKEYPIN